MLSKNAYVFNLAGVKGSIAVEPENLLKVESGDETSKVHFRECTAVGCDPEIESPATVQGKITTACTKPQM